MADELDSSSVEIRMGLGLFSAINSKNGNRFKDKLAKFLKMLCDNYGYIIYTLGISDVEDFEPYEYSINVNGCDVSRGYVYPDRCMVLAQEWESTGKALPDDIVISMEPVKRNTCYWIKEKCLGNLKKISALKAEDVIIADLERIVIDYVDKILLANNVEDCMALCELNNSHIIDNIRRHWE